MVDIIFDIDGTIANLDHRLAYVRSQPKNWPAFARGIKDDLPIPQTMHLLTTLAKAGNTIILCSGRNEKSRQDTIDWCRKYDIWQHIADLYMRADGDYRSDDIVKEELLDEIISQGFDPHMVFDDRPQVGRMWRKRGIFVLDVNQSGVEF